jgi:hypothetical protein
MRQNLARQILKQIPESTALTAVPSTIGALGFVSHHELAFSARLKSEATMLRRVYCEPTTGHLWAIAGLLLASLRMMYSALLPYFFGRLTLSVCLFLPVYWLPRSFPSFPLTP